jgi:hypothetical protein
MASARETHPLRGVEPAQRVARTMKKSRFMDSRANSELKESLGIPKFDEL